MSHQVLGPQFAWHVSSPRNRRSIEAEGLRSDPFYQNIPRHQRHIWLFTSRDVAEEATKPVPHGFGTRKRRADLWRADVSGMEMQPDPHPGWGSLRPGWDEASRVVSEPIPPERVKRMRPRRKRAS